MRTRHTAMWNNNLNRYIDIFMHTAAPQFFSRSKLPLHFFFSSRFLEKVHKPLDSANAIRLSQFCTNFKENQKYLSNVPFPSSLTLFIVIFSPFQRLKSHLILKVFALNVCVCARAQKKDMRLECVV